MFTLTQLAFLGTGDNLKPSNLEQLTDNLHYIYSMPISRNTSTIQCLLIP